jgi:hypothetical protein
MLFIKIDQVWRSAEGEEAPRHICDGGEGLAIAYDCESGAALHVGGENAVRKWADDYRARAEGYYASTVAANDAKGAQFAQDMMQNLAVAAMPVCVKSVELINFCLANGGAIRHFIRIGKLPGPQVSGDRAAA